VTEKGAGYDCLVVASSGSSAGFLAGLIFGSGLMLFDLKALHDYFYELATEQPELNRASRKKPRNSINSQKRNNDEIREQVVHLASRRAQI